MSKPLPLPDILEAVQTPLVKELVGIIAREHGVDQVMRDALKNVE